MLYGPQGIGKAHFAFALARRLLCLTPEQDQACGTCRSCRLNHYGSHPDLWIVEPEQDNRQIQIGQIRALYDKFSVTAHQKGWKIAVFQPAEAMNLYAANALLKQLEEPAAKSVFLLVSSEPGKLLPTVRSRCQPLRFPLPDIHCTVDWLKNQLPAAAKPEQLLALNRGRPLSALHNTREQNNCREQWQQDWEELIFDNITGHALAARWDYPKQPELSAESLQWLCNWLQDCLYWKTVGHFRNLTAAALQPAMIKLAQRLDCRYLIAVHRDCLAGYGLLTAINSPNRLLLLEGLFATLSPLLAGKGDRGSPLFADA